MPQVEILIGGRSFEVACQPGEESFLQSAAAVLDGEAAHLAEQIGRMPEARMLLMAGLMLADKTSGLEEKLTNALAESEQLRHQIEALQSRPAPEPVRVEVPVVPASIAEALAEIAARAEALADHVEGQV